MRDMLIVVLLFSTAGCSAFPTWKTEIELSDSVTSQEISLSHSDSAQQMEDEPSKLESFGESALKVALAPVLVLQFVVSAPSLLVILMSGATL